jgi:hypothetical protein
VNRIVVFTANDDSIHPGFLRPFMTGKHSAAKSKAATGDAVNNGAADNKSVLSEHKGKLAIGVAATLGLMIFYNWRQKNLPKEDPEAYARLQRFKDFVKADAASDKHGHNGRHRKAAAGK